ncbi:MAG TPA: glycoside hydrolase family protein [bacterium]|nr:glycoside hydrolase family protein [bacterium]HPN45453.1 glycoside hydrolase family protein [bacterium]
MNYDRLFCSIKKHEGKNNRMYRDGEGILTIGYGHNLETGELRDEAIELILQHDVEAAEQAVRSELPYFDELSDLRRETLVEMVFNLGLPRFLGFKKMLAALEVRDYAAAAREMLDSKWARQVGKRAKTLARQMRRGV